MNFNKNLKKKYYTCFNSKKEMNVKSFKKNCNQLQNKIELISNEYVAVC